jgi:hypothetical protein
MVQVLICHHDILKHTHSLWLLDLGIYCRMLYSSPNGFLILLGSHCYRLSWWALNFLSMQTMRHMSKQVRNFIQKITKVDQDFYPEYLGKMFIVNAPTAFKAMWAVVRPWLDKRTQKKIEVHGGNFSPKLLELVEGENLPAFLGGSCCCPGGCENADAGPWNERIYQQQQVYDESSKAMD